MKRVLIFFLILVFSFFLGTKVFAQSSLCSPDNIKNLSLGDARACQQDLQKALEQSQSATKPLQSQLESFRAQINAIKARVSIIESQLSIKRGNIEQGYKNLTRKQQILDRAIRNFYIKSYYNTPLLIFLSAPRASELTQVLAYQKAATDEDKVIITNIALTVHTLEQQKLELENEEASLSVLKKDLDLESAKLDKIVGGAIAYQNSLSSLISQLSARQQEILGQRLSALGIPLFASSLGACSSDLTNGKDPGFGGGFGMFTYGVPNRVGLNQFGAWGRAKAGQDRDTILHAYYNFDSISDANQGIQISVQGYGTYSLEDYVKRIYEVPDSWTDNDSAALKAQAIAVRSYVLAYTGNGAGSICSTEQCQVFKPDPKGGNWENAVNATAGKIMAQGGSPIKAWFSSTHGGYTHSSGDIGWSGTSWTKTAQDTTSPVSSFSDLKSNAYDHDSPWFYCDWGARSAYGATAWLKSDELADIVNVLLLAQRDSSVKEHLYQTDRGNPAGTDTWDSGRIKSELSSRGGTPFNSISSASVAADFSSGNTTTVNLSGDAGSVSFSGADFKTYFNLRAPANIQIVGPLYNIERH